MKPLNWILTGALLKIVIELEDKINILEEQGVRIFDLERLKCELIMTVFVAHDIPRNDTAIDYLSQPIFNCLAKEIDERRCLEQIDSLLQEFRRERSVKQA